MMITRFSLNLNYYILSMLVSGGVLPLTSCRHLERGNHAAADESPVPARNPIIRTLFSAAPAARVWPESDQLWLYTAHDPSDASSHDSMVDYHAFSSEDLVNWQDHGAVLRLKDVAWAAEKAWAADAVYRDGTYYLVYGAVEQGSKMFRAGLATSKLPQGPFTDSGYIAGVEWGQDPSIFIDDDKQAYLYWGHGGRIYAARLNQDLRSVVSDTIRELTKQLPKAYEGPGLHKRLGVYYLTYAAVYDMEEGERIEYATSSAPLGPFQARGRLMNYTGAWTNHGSIVEYKNQWYFFYHTNWLSQGVDYRRSVQAESLQYRKDGSIYEMTPSLAGVTMTQPTPFCSEDTLDPDANGIGMQNGVPCRIWYPTCGSDSDDMDGDGIGYLDGKRCIAAYPYCLEHEGDGWGYENGRSCKVFNPR